MNTVSDLTAPRQDTTTLMRQLDSIPLGDVLAIGRHLVARWGDDLYEIVTYGRRQMGRSVVALLIHD